MSSTFYHMSQHLYSDGQSICKENGEKWSSSALREHICISPKIMKKPLATQFRLIGLRNKVRTRDI